MKLIFLTSTVAYFQSSRHQGHVFSMYLLFNTDTHFKMSFSGPQISSSSMFWLKSDDLYELLKHLFSTNIPRKQRRRYIGIDI